jgi:hypothetical protein
MNRQVAVGETDPLKTRVYFDVRLLDGTPALGEDGQQPQVSINGSSFSPTGISVISVVGFGSYTAQLAMDVLAVNSGDIIITRYSRVGITLESRGDIFQAIDNSFTEVNVSTVVVDYYGTVIDADTYWNTRLPSRIWAGATQDNKIKAMRMATQAIDRLNIAGLKQDDNQILQFPRRNDMVIDSTDPGADLDAVTVIQTFSIGVPEDIKVATYICAEKFLGGWDADSEITNLMALENRIGPAASKYDRSFALEYVKAGIPSPTAWLLIRPYLRDPMELSLSRAT